MNETEIEITSKFLYELSLMAAGIGTFGILSLGFVVILVKLKTNPLEALKIVGIITIVTLSCCLVVLGFSEKQMTPVIGLLGTIAGYLLGFQSNNKDHQE